jgi:hypothetical protein
MRHTFSARSSVGKHVPAPCLKKVITRVYSGGERASGRATRTGNTEQASVEGKTSVSILVGWAQPRLSRSCLNLATKFPKTHAGRAHAAESYPSCHFGRGEGKCGFWPKVLGNRVSGPKFREVSRRRFNLQLFLRPFKLIVLRAHEASTGLLRQDA